MGWCNMTTLIEFTNAIIKRDMLYKLAFWYDASGKRQVRNQAYLYEYNLICKEIEKMRI
jgi:hypothetical protein